MNSLQRVTGKSQRRFRSSVPRKLQTAIFGWVSSLPKCNWECNNEKTSRHNGVSCNGGKRPGGGPSGQGALSQGAGRHGLRLDRILHRRERRRRTRPEKHPPRRAGRSFFEQSYLSPQGGLGGAQVGYNWQTNSIFGPLVLGVEADIQGAGIRDDRPACCFAAPAPNRPVRSAARLVRHGSRPGRRRQRSGAELLHRRLRLRQRQDQPHREFAGVGRTFTSNQNRGGWTSAAASKRRWAATGPPSSNTSTSISATGPTPSSSTDAAQTLDTEIRQNIFRVGLNYRIGGNSDYVTPPPANWTGFYLGGNFGGGAARNRSWLTSTAHRANERFNLSPDGIIGGVQAGYNWQAANWVFGVEADIQGSNQRDNRTCVLICQGLNTPMPTTMPSCPGSARSAAGSAIRSDRPCTMPPAVMPMAASRPTSTRPS